MFSRHQWVCRPHQPKRLGRVTESNPRRTIVQFGAGGPFKSIPTKDLRGVSQREIVDAGYEGIG